jgi:transcriptional regulator with XRE-family HTH domain
MKSESKKKMGVKKPSRQYDVHMAAFRANTFALLQASGLSQRGLAKLIPCSQAYICEVLHGREALAFQLMCNIADAFGRPILTMMTPGAFTAKPHTPRKAS